MDMALTDKVTMELDTIKMFYDRLSEMKPDARLRVFRYVEALLGEEE